MRLGFDSFEPPLFARSTPHPRIRRVPVRSAAPTACELVDSPQIPPPEAPEPLEPQELAPEELAPDSAAPPLDEPVSEADPSVDADELAKAMARVERESRREIERERRALVAGFLEVLDDLDRAIDACESGCDEGAPLMQGVELVRERFLCKLRDRGVTRFDDRLRPFDPQRHEALSVVDVTDEQDDGLVMDVARAGYLIDGELLRPASVVVGRLRS